MWRFKQQTDSVVALAVNYVGKIFDALLHQHVTTDGSSVRAFVPGNQVYRRGI